MQLIPFVLGSLGCVGVERMPLSQPASSPPVDDVRLEVNEVAASRAFLAQRQGGTGSVFGVTLTVTRSGGQSSTTLLELDHAILIIADPAGELREEALSAAFGGDGPIPELVRFNQRPTPVVISGYDTHTAWVAFHTNRPLDERDLPRRIVLRIPVSGGGQPLEIVLAEPSTGRPRWIHEPIRSAGYAGVSVLGNFRETSVGILRSSVKTRVREHFVLGPSFYFGFRGGDLRNEREKTIACCDLGASFDFWFPFRVQDSAVGPWVSYQGVFALEDGRHDKAAWHGPSLGLSFSSHLIEPIVAGALPVRAKSTPLGYSSFTLAYTHLFRRRDDGGSPGFFMAFEHTLPEW